MFKDSWNISSIETDSVLLVQIFTAFKIFIKSYSMILKYFLILYLWIWIKTAKYLIFYQLHWNIWFLMKSQAFASLWCSSSIWNNTSSSKVEFSSDILYIQCNIAVLNRTWTKKIEREREGEDNFSGNTRNKMLLLNNSFISFYQHQYNFLTHIYALNFDYFQTFP